MKRALALLALVLCWPALGASRHATLVFTGDNGGEVAPCG